MAAQRSEARRAVTGKGEITYVHRPRCPAAAFRPKSMSDSSAVDQSDAITPTVLMMQDGRKASDKGLLLKNVPVMSQHI